MVWNLHTLVITATEQQAVNAIEISTVALISTLCLKNDTCHLCAMYNNNYKKKFFFNNFCLELIGYEMPANNFWNHLVFVYFEHKQEQLPSSNFLVQTIFPNPLNVTCNIIQKKFFCKMLFVLNHRKSCQLHCKKCSTNAGLKLSQWAVKHSFIILVRSLYVCTKHHIGTVSQENCFFFFRYKYRFCDTVLTRELHILVQWQLPPAKMLNDINQGPCMLYAICRDTGYMQTYDCGNYHIFCKKIGIITHCLTYRDDRR